MTRYYKTVLLPIAVAEGDYCWEQGNRICDHFANDRNTPRCTLGLCWSLQRDENGNYPKPESCLRLKSPDGGIE